DRLSLGDKRDARLESLSLGNQQRVQLAAALIGAPRLLLLDAPFSGLAPRAVASLAELLREPPARRVPVPFSSHQLAPVERPRAGLVIQSGGRVLARGTASELRRRGRVRHRLVTAGATGWLHDVEGVDVIERSEGTALLELATEEVADRLLAEALRR